MQNNTIIILFQKVIFLNVESNGNLILKDSRIIGFLAGIIALSNGEITCSPNYKSR